ncbi:MAG: hypothetical protein Q7S28_03435 [bacterium]|nr:hypothetical protein [bacterium]
MSRLAIERDEERSRWRKTVWLRTFYIGIVLIVLDLVALVGGGYVLETILRKVTPAHGLFDLVHRFLPVLDVRFLTHVGLLASIVMILIGCFYNPDRRPFIFLMVAYWVFVRTVCMIVTVLPIPEGGLPEYLPITHFQSFWDYVFAGLNTRYVLFFSGHTGLPFLGWLLFRKTRVSVKSFAFPLALATVIWFIGHEGYGWWQPATVVLGWFVFAIFHKEWVNLGRCMLIWSFIMAASVLLIRSHYTLDVIAAYGITGWNVYWLGKRYFFHKIEKICMYYGRDRTAATEQK